MACPPGRAGSAADALDRGAAGGELVLQPLEAAVEVIDAVDHGLAFRRERGDHERDRGAQVGRHDRRALEHVDTFDGRALAVELDAGAKPRQLLHVHEAVLEDGLGDAGGSLRPRHQRHQLRLQVGREAGERRGRHLDRLQALAVAGDAQAAVGLVVFEAGLGEHVETALQELGARVLEHHVAAGHGDRHGIGAGLDAIGQHAMALSLIHI